MLGVWMHSLLPLKEEVYLWLWNFGQDPKYQEPQNQYKKFPHSKQGARLVQDYLNLFIKEGLKTKVGSFSGRIQNSVVKDIRALEQPWSHLKEALSKRAPWEAMRSWYSVCVEMSHQESGAEVGTINVHLESKPTLSDICRWKSTSNGMGADSERVSQIDRRNYTVV